MEPQYTVADYLKQRLEQLNMQQMFGVAGNYTAPLLDTILADPDSLIKISGNANEMCAGYAADAYARLNLKKSVKPVTRMLIALRFKGFFRLFDPIAVSPIR